MEISAAGGLRITLVRKYRPRAATFCGFPNPAERTKGSESAFPRRLRGVVAGKKHEEFFQLSCLQQDIMDQDQPRDVEKYKCLKHLPEFDLTLP
jgi:hypothetical protein